MDKAGYEPRSEARLSKPSEDRCHLKTLSLTFEFKLQCNIHGGYYIKWIILIHLVIKIKYFKKIYFKNIRIYTDDKITETSKEQAEISWVFIYSSATKVNKNIRIYQQHFYEYSDNETEQAKLKAYWSFRNKFSPTYY